MIDEACHAKDPNLAHVEELIRELGTIRADLIELEQRESARVSEIPEFYQGMPVIFSITLPCDVTTFACCKRNWRDWVCPRWAGLKVMFWQQWMRS